MVPAWLTSISAKLAIAAAIAVIIVGGWLYIGKLQAQKATLAISVSELKGVNKQNATTIVQMQDDVKRYDAIEASVTQADLVRQSDTAAKHAAIDALPSAPIAASSSQTLDLLRDTP
jgi:hypothetical protein